MNRDSALTAAADREATTAGADDAPNHAPGDNPNGYGEEPLKASPADAAGPTQGAHGQGGAQGDVQGGAQGDELAAAVVYRTPEGWRVGGHELPDLINAMVFADLLAAELPPPRARARGTAGRDTTDGEPTAAEAARLKTTVAQLEHALITRVRVEQAIGVLTERHRLQPRKAFELLRSAARTRGRRVQELADDVVANVVNPLLPIPEELARPPKPAPPRRRARRI